MRTLPYVESTLRSRRVWHASISVEVEEAETGGQTTTMWRRPLGVEMEKRVWQYLGQAPGHESMSGPDTQHPGVVPLPMAQS